MKTAILGLFAASALGCAAVADGRLETAVNNAEPITLVSGEEHAPVRGTIETPAGVCNGKADVMLSPEYYKVVCGDYKFVHSESEGGGFEDSGETFMGGHRFWYSYGETNDLQSWRWESSCHNSLFHRMPIPNDPEGALLNHSFYDRCEEPLTSCDFVSSRMVAYENQPGRYYTDLRSPLSFTLVREPTEGDIWNHYVLGTEEDFEQKLQEYNSLQQQMNVPEADRLWREWRHTALGYVQ
ncbi:MAG: hypothetical protein WC852_02850 [Candidatus Nanoarchaeia archaeon]